MGIYACGVCGNPNGWFSGTMRDVHDCPGPPMQQWPGQPQRLDWSEIDDTKGTEMNNDKPAVALPDLPTIPDEDCIPYQSIRYTAGYPKSYVQKYAVEYARAAIEALPAAPAVMEAPEVVAYLNHKAGMPPSVDSAATAGTLRSEPLVRLSDLECRRCTGSHLDCVGGWRVCEYRDVPLAPMDAGIDAVREELAHVRSVRNENTRELQDEINRLRAALAATQPAVAVEAGWQPIETAPKDALVSIWIVGTNAAGQKWSSEPGVMWAYCYYDSICGEWRTSSPSGHLRCVPERFVTHWQSTPTAPGAAPSRMLARRRGDEAAHGHRNPGTQQVLELHNEGRSPVLAGMGSGRPANLHP